MVPSSDIMTWSHFVFHSAFALLRHGFSLGLSTKNHTRGPSQGLTHIPYVSTIYTEAPSDTGVVLFRLCFILLHLVLSGSESLVQSQWNNKAWNEPANILNCQWLKLSKVESDSELEFVFDSCHVQEESKSGFGIEKLSWNKYQDFKKSCNPIHSFFFASTRPDFCITHILLFFFVPRGPYPKPLGVMSAD